MPSNNTKNRIEEIRHLVADSDLNLASRRLLDFMTDFMTSSDLLRHAVDLRAKYNELMSRDTQPESEMDALRVEFMEFIESLENEFRRNDTNYDHSETKSSQVRKKSVCRGKDITKRYSSVGFALTDIQLDMKQGEITGIVGENGNGKTTLLRIVAGDLSLDNGKIMYPALEVKEDDWYSIKQNVAFIPQRLKSWRGSLKDNLHFSAANHGIFGRENEEIVEYIIHRLGLTRYRNSGWSEISSGYKLRFELAKALVWHPKLLILDEPLANLDINTKLLFMQDLRLLANSERYPISILMSSQQLHEVESVVDNIIFLKEGNPLYNGKVTQFGEDRLSNTFELAGDFSRVELTNLMSVFPDVEIEETGQSFLVDVPTETEGNDILRHLLQTRKIDYFRDISRSTRKLF